ncbi:methyltransferase domain-containing protein [Embleya sp. AB8]|uniref:methyltransferase domain-containing protein n=1 Tax=Embleya sp. AB8 TaxID=3156304 RepID=UPI003C75DA27
MSVSEREWAEAAGVLAEEVATPGWADAVAGTPRHLLVPAWWAYRPPTHWERVDAYGDPGRWRVAYTDATLVTRVGARHADDVGAGDTVTGSPTSSSTLPSLVVAMFEHAEVAEGDRVIDVGTGSGYSAALLAHRLGGDAVTSVDVDPYLVRVARERVGRLGRRPEFGCVDADRALPGQGYDALVAMVSVRPVPAAWLAAVRSGGRIVATIAGTSLLIRARVRDDGTACGRVLADSAGFMRTRVGDDYPSMDDVFRAGRDAEGDSVTTDEGEPYDLAPGGDVRTLVTLATGATDFRGYRREDGAELAWILHSDGSWARIERCRAAGGGGRSRSVHQGGPRALWDEARVALGVWEERGRPSVRDFAVTVTPDATTLVWDGPAEWRITL